MGKSANKDQVVVYLSPELHRRLRIAAASAGVPSSRIVEEILSRNLGSLADEIAVSQDDAKKP